MILIRPFRIKAGLTQTELAERVGVVPSAVSMWETGETNPSTEKIRRIAAILGCSVGDLFSDDAMAGEATSATGPTPAADMATLTNPACTS